ncbi:hypothetical protein M0R72_16920 [Candidatus Pacearchaeota archaeon]|jgi:uncharacterized membrane protein|nr:hypothetical protein [Candidatus Pacearchaeota archaeon]
MNWKLFFSNFKIFKEIFDKNWDILITGIIIGIVLFVMQSDVFRKIHPFQRAIIAFFIGLALILIYSLGQYLDKIFHT